jgi:hypothetical protein
MSFSWKILLQYFYLMFGNAWENLMEISRHSQKSSFRRIADSQTLGTYCKYLDTYHMSIRYMTN